jgi:glycosyltransferase involved in cell wall biosynthesis
MTSFPFVSIIIPTYRDWNRLSLTIDALTKQTYPADYFEVIIINNDPQDLVPANYFLSGNMQIVSEVKPGSYAARNKGLSLAKGEIYGFTDSDCIPHPDWIENAVKMFADEKIDRIGGQIDLIYRNSKDKTWIELYESIYELDQKRIVRVHKASVTANLFARKSLFEKVGPFDGNKMSGDDFGWNRRANALGYNIIYGENVKISHPARSTFKEFTNKKRREFGGKKNTKVTGLKSILKHIVYIPFLFYMVVIRLNGRVFSADKRLSVTDVFKIFLVNIYLFFINAGEFFRLLLGGSKVR